jgi:hypothetical protein
MWPDRLTRQRISRADPEAADTFVLTSGQIGTDAESSPLSLSILPVMIGLAIVLYCRRHRVDREPLETTRAGAETAPVPA